MMNSFPYATEIETDKEGFHAWLRFWRLVIAAEQIGGGFFGLYIVASVWAKTSIRELCLLTAIFFLAAIVGGVLLAQGKPSGVTLSLVVQALQILQISTPALLLVLVCGMQLLIGEYQTDIGTNLGFAWRLSSGFFIILNPPAIAAPRTGDTGIGTGGSAEAITGVNLVALLAIICLLIIRASLRNGNVPAHKPILGQTPDVPQNTE